MASRLRQPIIEDSPGAPEWMVTFSDCMTLLLTFFVLLLSFSSFDDKIYKQFYETIFIDLPYLFQEVKRSRDAMLDAEQIISTDDLDAGSEKTTFDEKSVTNTIKEKEPKEFHNKKVFYSNSENIFWGEGAVISNRGREALSLMGEFLKRVPGMIAVSENTLESSGSEQLGLQRAWAVIEYLTKEKGLEKGRFNITSHTMLDNASRSSTADKRLLEIVILERSIYQ